MFKRGLAGFGRTSGLFRALIIVVLILTMVSVLVVFERQAKSAREQSALIVGTQLRVSQLEAVVLERLARGPLPDDPVVNAEATALASAATASIASIDPGPATRHFAEYLQIASRVRALTRTAHLETANAIAAVQLVPAFDVVLHDLDAARASVDERAANAELMRELGSILTLIIGGFFLMLMFKRAERVRRHLVTSKVLETALEESQRRFASLLSESSDLVTVLDRNGRVTFQSSSIERMLGWTVEDIVGHDIREFLDEGQADRIPVVLRQAELRPDSQRSVEFQMRRSDGEMLGVEAVVIGRFDDPDITGCLLNIR
jgi:PAS domain S-box-containing protein